LFRKIRGADFTFHEQYWKDVSVSAKQLIASLLHTDPKYRWTAAEALEKSSWLRAKAAELTKKDLSSSLTEMRKLQRKRLLKGAAHAVVVGVKLKLANSNNSASLDKQVDNTWNGNRNNSWDRYQQDEDQHKRVDRALLSSSEPSLRFEDVYELAPGQEPLHANLANGVEIWACQHKERKENYAVKIINDNDPNKKLSTGKTVSESVLHELAVLKSLKHPHIIDIIDFFEQDEKFYLVMERMDGGDVFDRIISLKKYTEMDAQNLAKILLDAVYCMHSQGKDYRVSLLFCAKFKQPYFKIESLQRLFSFNDKQRPNRCGAQGLKTSKCPAQIQRTKLPKYQIGRL
jgi:serine/threonine protein kinase